MAAPPNMPIRSNNPNSPRPPMGRPNMPPSFAVRGPGRPGFAEECRRQSRLVAAADASDPELNAILDAALADLDDLAES